jgi:hypothetical protein
LAAAKWLAPVAASCTLLACGSPKALLLDSGPGRDAAVDEASADAGNEDQASAVDVAPDLDMAPDLDGTSCDASALPSVITWTAASSDAGIAEVVERCDHGWCWTVPGPSASSLLAIWGSSDDDVWVVGESEQALHWNGTAWSAFDLPPSPTGSAVGLDAIWGSGPADVWATGYGMVHWDGAVWSLVSTPDGRGYGSLSGTGPADVWALGSGAPPDNSAHWDGHSWTPITIPYATSIWAAAPDDVWVVGNGTSHWDGHVWTTSAVLGAGSTVVWGSGSTDVWAAGTDIWHWDGVTWSVAKHGIDIATAIWGGGPSDVWVVSEDGDLLHWDGATWSTSLQRLPRGGSTIWGTGAGDVWLIGADLQHWTGSEWVVTPMSPGTQGGRFLSFGGTAADDVWAVTSIEGELAHWDGAAWSDVPTGTTGAIGGVAAIGGDDAWLVGEGGTVLRWNGSVWQPVDSGTNADLRSVWTSGPEDAWATTANGLLHWDGRAWTQKEPSSCLWTALDVTPDGGWGSGPDDVWIVDSQHGLLVHWDGSAWAVVGDQLASNDEIVAGIAGSAADDVWAVMRPTMGFAHWDGLAWSGTTYDPVEIGSTEGGRLLGVWAGSRPEAWAAALQGVWRWDGVNWSLNVPSFTHAGWSSPAGSAWAVGDGVVMRR